MSIWSKLSHENIIVLEGFILEDVYPAIISRWAEGGTVTEYVKSNPDCNLLIIVGAKHSQHEECAELYFRYSGLPTVWRISIIME